MNAKNQAMLASYGRHFISAAGVVVATGNTDLRAILIAGAIATAPVALRALNPKDPAFGVGADLLTAELNKLVKADVKKTAKKAAPKK
jgi:hypothetical protein